MHNAAEPAPATRATTPQGTRPERLARPEACSGHLPPHNALLTRLAVITATIIRATSGPWVGPTRAASSATSTSSPYTSGAPGKRGSKFFLEGVTETSRQAAETARELLGLFERESKRFEQLGRPAASVLRVHQLLQQRPVVAIPAAARRLGLSVPTVTKSIQHREQLGVVREITGKRRGRRYAYDDYLAILNRGTEPLSR